MVLKNHYEPTAGLAYVVRKEVPGIEIFGGICLDRTVGGLNPAAVDHMAHMKGGWGRVVWMPTFDAENQVRFDKANRPFVSVSKNGKLLPEVNDTLAVIAKYRLVMETGHVSAEEGLMVIRAGKAAGVTHMVVTHAMMPPIKMPSNQMKQAAAMGAYIEFVYRGLLENRESSYPITSPRFARSGLSIAFCRATLGRRRIRCIRMAWRNFLSNCARRIQRRGDRPDGEDESGENFGIGVKAMESPRRGFLRKVLGLGGVSAAGAAAQAQGQRTRTGRVPISASLRARHELPVAEAIELRPHRRQCGPLADRAGRRRRRFSIQRARV